MGTGSKGKSGPRMGLPFRRYSVPEIVMRKYSLSRAQTSASEIGTVPTPSVPSMGTSQESKTKRMSHKACQTSPPANTDDTQSSTYATGSMSYESEPPLIPTVTIIEETTDSSKNPEKYSSTSTEYSQSENVESYSAQDRHVYKGDLSLPGAIAQSTMFLTVPEPFLDPHDCPQEAPEEVFGNEIIKCIVQSPTILSSDKMVDTVDVGQEKNVRQLTPTQQRDLLRLRSNSVPESSEPSVKIVRRTGSAGGKNHNELEIQLGGNHNEINVDLGDSISPEGTPTPAPTCHTFDSQGNMSECYITDCDLCVAEGRKCCSLDDSGSQSCSFTSPEMLTSNELKTSSDYTTSSMTLDQSVSDRTTSTQDSTVSLTSISPESDEAKTKLSGITISPILVIDSEAMLIGSIPTKSKELSHRSEASARSKCTASVSLLISNSFPAVITSETALVPENEILEKKKYKNKNSDITECLDITKPLKKHSQNSKLPETNNNNKEIDSRADNNNQTIADEFGSYEISEGNVEKTIADEFGSYDISEGNVERNEIQKEKSTNYTNYLYLTDSETASSQAQNGKPTKSLNYSTNYLYLTESESSSNPNQGNENLKTENYKTNYLYLTESDSGLSQAQNDKEKQKGENYSTNYLYLTESSESKPSEIESDIGVETNKPTEGNYSTNYMYLTEESSSSQVPNNGTDREIEKIKTYGSYKTNLLYLTEDSSSSQTKSDSDIKRSTENYSKDLFYLSESASPSTNDNNEIVSDLQKIDISQPNTGNYTTNALYLTETESESIKTKSDSEQQKQANCSTHFLYLTESGSSSGSTKPMIEGPKSENYSNYTENYLYLTESESGSSKNKSNCKQPKTGNYSKNFLYLTESETSSSNNNDIEQPKTGNYSTNFLYLTESESGSSPAQNNCSEKKNENYSTNYLYLTESETKSSKGCNSTVESTNQNQNTGDKATNVFYMTEDTEDGSVSKLTKNDENTEKSNKNPNNGKNVSNYLYLTEDESVLNPDSLEPERVSSKESEFETDSLVINESTEEDSKLLENLGFCENQANIQEQSCDFQNSDKKPKQNFYGNEKYELLLKESDHNKDNFLGNVRPLSGEKSVRSMMEKNLSPSPMPDISSGASLILDEKELENLRKNRCEIDISQISSERETSMGSVAGGTYWELPGKELVIPRFSAMPRTLSMIVNTSSVDCSSDSDLSLADSLEDSKSDEKSRGLKLYNKYDNRLARGDIISLLPEESSAPKKTTNNAHAYFLSLTGEEGEIKIEHIPDEIKKKLLKRYSEVKKHTNHSPGHDSNTKGKSSSCKRGKKHHRHSCLSNKTEISHKSSEKTSKSSEREGTSIDKGQISAFTQWEDLGSSKESSDTLVPSDFSNKEKGNVFEGDIIFKNASTSYDFGKFQESNQNIHNWLEMMPQEDKNESHKTEKKILKDFGTSTSEKNNSIEEKNNINKFVNSWVQCENMPHVDTILDEEISNLLIQNFKEDESTPQKGKFKCSEHQVPWFKDIDVQVSETDLVEKKMYENADRIRQIQLQENESSSLLSVSSSVQTQEEDLNLIKLLELNNKQIPSNLLQKEETNKIKFKLNVSPTKNYSEDDIEMKYFQGNDDNDKNNTSQNGKVTFLTDKPTKQDKGVFNKHATKFNMKTIPSRRPGNLSTRFKQKFEVIPEEKSGSMESSNDERKSPKATRARRASMPSDMILTDISQIKHKSSGSTGSSSSSNEKNETDDHLRNIQSPIDGTDYHRRHTIHGNLATRNNKSGMDNNSSFEKNEQSRRHTIHGSLALNSKNEAMLKQLNLIGGTLLKGRVFGKQSGVMFGRFRPINEETQVQKDERSFVEEHLERLRVDTSKGREALAVAKAEEQDDLMTLSKGWINFYLLRDSQDLNSESSNGEEGSQEQSSEDRLRRAPPTLKTVTVLGKPEEEVRHQYTVHINASPEKENENERLPDLGPFKSKTPLSLSPDLTLPEITPSSSPTISPPLDLPHIHPRPPTRTNRNINDKNNHNSKKPPDVGDKKENVRSIENEHNLRYMKLSSVKQELQTEKTYLARSGELACSELSPSSQSSSSVMVDSPTLPSIKWPSRQLQRRAPRHSRHPHHSANPQACWTVTLAGSSGHPTQPPPDVEMRLSFSNASRAPPTSQSDSGLGEDGPSERPIKQQALPPALPQNNHWKVMLKTQQETDRSSDQTRADKRQSVPDFNYTPSTARTKKNSKRRGQEDADQPVSVKVQEILEHNISLHKSSLTEEEWMEGLSVTGLAITPERKPRVPTMSERDLTRQWLHRTRLSQ